MSQVRSLGRRGTDHHPLFTAVLEVMADEARLGWDAFGRILTRVVISGEPVQQVEIAQGSMLARARPLSPTTVSRGAKQMVALGLLADTTRRPKGPSGRVLPALQVGRDAWAVVGVHLGQRDGAVHEIVAVLVELGSERVLSRVVDEEVSEDGYSDAEHVLARTAAVVNCLIDWSCEEGRSVLGVGVEVGGQVYEGSIMAYAVGSFATTNFARRLSEALPARFPEGAPHLLRGIDLLQRTAITLPVILENDVNALALQRAYHPSGSRNFAVVALFHEGVGGAIIRDGRVVRGSGGAAGEIGHLTAEYQDDNWEDRKMSSPGPNDLSRPAFDDPCACGELGHLQCLATTSRILAELGHNATDDPTILMVVFEQAAASPGRVDDKLTETGRVFRRSGRALGRGLVQFLTATDPGELVLLLPHPLHDITGGTAAWEYRDAIERELDHGFSNTARSARRGGAIVLTESLRRLPDIAEQGAIAATTCVIDAFIDHARGRDECEPAPEGQEPVPAATPPNAEDDRIANMAQLLTV